MFRSRFFSACASFVLLAPLACSESEGDESSGSGGQGEVGVATGGNGAAGSDSSAGGARVGSGGEASGSGGEEGYTGPWPPSETFDNPVLWEDLADIDVIRVGDTYYYMASNMHYSPGAPILRSYDLVEWEYAGHAVPVLDYADKYDMNGGTAYVKGTWASFLNYRKSNETFYFGACIEFGRSYIYTAKSVEGPWQKHPAINNCYYDGGLLIDDDDKMYVAYGNTTIRVAELSSDGLREVRNQQVYQTPSDIGTLEGARFYKINGSYYIFLTKPPNGQYILKSTNPFGPYELQKLLDPQIGTPIPGGGTPHQGGLVETQKGDWYYLSFTDVFPGGRIPTLAPITWNTQGWPVLETVNGKWGVSYPYPDVPRPPRRPAARTGIEHFVGPQLAHEWEWNHNPDNTKWSFDQGLRLSTATITQDLYKARNTLTRRILGPTSTATIELDVSRMRDGDRAGLAMFRHVSAWVGVKKTGNATSLVMVNDATMNLQWQTTSTGTEVASAPLVGSNVWLRVAADIRPGGNRQARFFVSTDGEKFSQLGPDFTLNNQWEFFMGYRFALLNYATSALGGSVTVKSFELTTP